MLLSILYGTTCISMSSKSTYQLTDILSTIPSEPLTPWRWICSLFASHLAQRSLQIKIIRNITEMWHDYWFKCTSLRRPIHISIKYCQGNWINICIAIRVKLWVSSWKKTYTYKVGSLLLRNWSLRHISSNIQDLAEKCFIIISRRKKEVSNLS